MYTEEFLRCVGLCVFVILRLSRLYKLVADLKLFRSPGWEDEDNEDKQSH